MKIETRNLWATITIDPAELDSFLRDDADDELREASGWPDDPEDQVDHALHFLTEANDVVMGQVAAFGLRLIDGQIVIVTYADDPLKYIRQQFEGISALTNFVTSTYDNRAPDVNDWGPMLSGLGGDDDVDYNGGYLDIACEIILAYIEARI